MDDDSDLDNTEPIKERDGLTQVQIAEALGCSPRQAKRIEDRAMKKLAEMLRQRRITLEDLRE
jgi:DNA-directed RNA polymerase specialized sigma24 family protein